MTGSVVIAWQTLSRHKLRSALTAVSLILGVMTLTSVAAAEGVVQHAISRAALLTGGPATTTSIAVTSTVAPDEAATRWADTFTQRFGPQTLTARTVSSGALTVATDGKAAPEVDLLLVDPRLTRIRPFEVISGAWLADAPRTLAPNVALNTAAADRFTNARSWELRWGNEGASTTAVAVGTVDDGRADPTIYVDLTQSGTWRNVALANGAVSLLVHAPGVNQSTVAATVREVEKLAGHMGETGDVVRTDTVEELLSQRTTASRVFFAIAGMSLAVGALGVLNIGLATLAERSEELALRRAFGAHRSAIAWIMLLESQLLGAAAALIGIGASYVCMPLTLRLLGSSAAPDGFSLSAALTGAAAGCLAALIGAMAPAIRASQLPIGSIMRA